MSTENTKYTILIVNNLFEDDNLIIIKSSGSQTIIREKEAVTPEYIHDYVENRGIDLNDCYINVVDKDWRGLPAINTY